MNESDDRQARALELHLAGATYDAIAKSVGYASRSGAHKAVRAALEKAPPSGDLVQTELARLDALLTAVWPKARRGDLQAIDRALRISERRTMLAAMAPAEAAPEPTGSVLDELTARREGRGADVSIKSGRGAPSG